MCRLHKGRHFVKPLHKVSSMYNSFVSIMARRIAYILASCSVLEKEDRQTALTYSQQHSLATRQHGQRTKYHRRR
jgi:hypothetical protein